MGKHARKTPYKKLLKEEKAKTKLRVSHKTLLPKGQNITDTSFKVRKIVVKSQLKEHSGEIVSKTNLNVKELLSRLQHHNAPLRLHSLSSLCEIVDGHADSVLNTNLSVLLHAASNLILDKEQDVRTEAIKLLSTILSKTSTEQLSELFEIIMKHLACAMSHIDTNIRSSSLAMLDVLIAKHPKLTAKHCQSVILPAFLDLISTKYADSERKLIMQYSEKMTTNIWRIKVLTRLQALLQAIVSIRKEENSVQEEQEYVKRIRWEDGRPINVSLYSWPFDRNRLLDMSRLQAEKNRTQFDHNNEIKNYTELLMPLLLDIFVEVGPQKSKSHKTAPLSNEAAVLLKLLVNVILFLWEIFESCDSSNQLKSWFSIEFGGLIVERTIIGRFPYSLLEHNQIPTNTGKKKGKNCVTLPGVLGQYSQFLADQRCAYLNVALSHIYLLLYRYSSNVPELRNVMQYVLSVLPSCLQMDRESVIQLLNCADAFFSLDWKKDSLKFDTVELIKVIKQLYQDSSTKTGAHHSFVTEKTFTYLYKIVSSERHNAAHYFELTSWLDSLPNLLTGKKISFHVVKCIANVARYNVPAFSNSLDGYIESILDNLPRLEIITDRKTDRNEGKKLIANLLYSVQTWDEELITGLRKALGNGYFAHLNNHVKDIVECKLSTQ